MRFLVRSSIFINSSKFYRDVRFVASFKHSMVLKQLPDLPTILNQSVPNDNFWKDIRSKILQTCEMKELTIDTSLLDLCFLEIPDKDRFKAMIRSYFQFLKNNYTFNTATAYKIMKWISADEVSESDKEIIIWLYENVFKTYPILDSTLTDVLMTAIAKTEKWKECEHIYSKGTKSTFNTFKWIETCFQHDRPEVGWDHLNKLGTNVTHVFPNLNRSYIEYCLRNYNDKSKQQLEVERLFAYYKERDLILRTDSADELIEASPLLGWKGEYVNIDETGICPSCNKKLSQSHLSKEDYNRLSNFVMDKVIISSDIYKNTCPKELEQFINFIDKTIPYDVVIDGLNLFYFKKKSTVFFTSTIEHFQMSNKKILVLCRKHMIPYLKKLRIKNVYTFCLDNLSKDDPYMLYAALKSGPQTLFLSNDLMRSQKFQLNDFEIRKLFKKWQLQNQIINKVDNQNTRRLKFDPLLHFLPVINSDEKGWHMPHSENVLYRDTYESFKDWICIRK